MKKEILYGAALVGAILLIAFFPGYTIAAFLLLAFLLAEPERRKTPLLLRPFVRRPSDSQTNSKEVSHE